MNSRKPHSAPIVFFGTDAFSVPSLVQLISGGYQIAAVVTKPDSPTGRGQKISEPAVKRLALAAGIKVLQPKNISEITNELGATKAAIGIVVAYGKIIPPDLLTQFPLGLVNVHASLLPKYRGASPIEHAILNGDEETGVTLMLPEEEPVPAPSTAAEQEPDADEQLEQGADRIGDALRQIDSNRAEDAKERERRGRGGRGGGRKKK